MSCPPLRCRKETEIRMATGGTELRRIDGPEFDIAVRVEKRVMPSGCLYEFWVKCSGDEIEKPSGEVFLDMKNLASMRADLEDISGLSNTKEPKDQFDSETPQQHAVYLQACSVGDRLWTSL